MSDHRIVAIPGRGFANVGRWKCSTCGKPVAWVDSTDPRHEPHVGYWDHAPVAVAR